jgi:hypothetical protein
MKDHPVKIRYNRGRTTLSNATNHRQTFAQVDRHFRPIGDVAAGRGVLGFKSPQLHSIKALTRMNAGQGLKCVYAILNHPRKPLTNAWVQPHSSVG